MRIFLVGGGTGGATAPVLAVAEALAGLKPGSKFYLVGSNGVEKKMIEKTNLPLVYLSIPAGKWRRYFSLMNFVDLFKIVFGFIKSLSLIGKYRPDVVFGAGSFVQVPLAFAAYLKKVPVVIHQPDFEVLRSTRLVSPFARAVSVSFGGTEKDMPEFSGLLKTIKKSKIHVTGNPVRQEVLGGSKKRGLKIFGLTEDYPVLLAMGGSQGSARLNEIILQAASDLVKYVQIIHVKGSKGGKGNKGEFSHQHYHDFEYLGRDLRDAYAAADIVICRGGISTITELSALGKAAIVVPLPASPQEINAELLARTKSAVVVFEEFLTAELLVSLVRKILWSAAAMNTIKKNIKALMPAGADKRIAKIILEIHGK